MRWRAFKEQLYTALVQRVALKQPTAWQMAVHPLQRAVTR
jgi:hypothetical protein